MKRLEEMSGAELCQLDEQEIENLIDLECAYAGAPLSVDKPIYSDIPKIPEADVIYYTVCGIDLTSKEEAYALADFANGLKTQVKANYDYDYSRGISLSKYKYIQDERPEPQAVEVGRAYSKNTYTELKDTLWDIAEAETKNKQLREEFAKKSKARMDIQREVKEAIRAAHLAAYEQEERTKLYNRYLYLANGSETVAASFYIEHFGGGTIPPEIIEEAKRIREHEQAARPTQEETEE